MPSKGPHAQLSLSLPPLLSQESMVAGAEERWDYWSIVFLPD
jgi:hypothetical protein